MRFHRSRRDLRAASYCLFLGAVSVALQLWLRDDRVGGACFAGAFWLALATWRVASQVRRFRVSIGPDGLTLLWRGVDRHLPWSQIQAVVLDRPRPWAPGPATWQELLLVPAEGVELGAPLTGTSPVDGRPCRLLLRSDETREPPDQVAEALTRYGGDRVVDGAEARRGRLRAEDLGMARRGYEITYLQGLVERGRWALDPGVPESDRRAVRAEIESAERPVFWPGYDRRQADALLRALSAALSRVSAESPAGQAAAPPRSA